MDALAFASNTDMTSPGKTRRDDAEVSRERVVIIEHLREGAPDEDRTELFARRGRELLLAKRAQR
jgi:hypothetical protein